jgi:hypothetical protein
MLHIDATVSGAGRPKVQANPEAAPKPPVPTFR